MNAGDVSNELASRFIAESSAPAWSIPSKFLEIAIGFIADLDIVPPKEVFMSALRDALERFFEHVDIPGPDELIEPQLVLAILTAASWAYDQVITEA